MRKRAITFWGACRDLGTLLKMIWADLDDPKMRNLALGTLVTGGFTVLILLFAIYGLVSSSIFVIHLFTVG